MSPDAVKQRAKRRALNRELSQIRREQHVLDNPDRDQDAALRGFKVGDRIVLDRRLLEGGI